MDSRKGWWVVLGCVLTMTITAGVGFSSMAVLADNILKNTGWDEMDFALGVTVWGLSAAIVSPFCGRWIDKYGPRPMIMAGICLAAIAEFMLGRVSQLWQYYTLLAILPLGIMLCTYMPIATVVTHWFRKKINIATGLAMLGIGLGGGLAPLITQELVAQYEFRTTFTILAGILLCALIPAYIWIHSPEDEFEEEDSAEKHVPHDSDLSLGRALKTRSFWGLSVGDMLTGMVFAIFTQLLVLYLINETNDEQFAAAVLATLSVGLGFGILVFGPLGDLFNFHRVIVLCYLLPAVGTVCILASDTHVMAFTFAVIAGFAGGGRSALFPVAITNSFGHTHMAAIYGVSNTLFMIGTGVGPIIAGLIYKETGNINHIYLFGIVLFVASAILVALIRDEREPEVSATTS